MIFITFDKIKTFLTFRTPEGTTCYIANTIFSYLRWKELFSACITFEELTKNPEVKEKRSFKKRIKNKKSVELS